MDRGKEQQWEQGDQGETCSVVQVRDDGISKRDGGGKDGELRFERYVEATVDCSCRGAGR